MVIGAIDLLDHFKQSLTAVAEGYIQGTIPKHLEPYVWHLVSKTQVAEARDRLKDRRTWKVTERLNRLEEEIRELQADNRRLLGDRIHKEIASP